MKAVIILNAVLLFASWILLLDDDSHILINAVAICFMLAFLFICMLVMQICGHAM